MNKISVITVVYNNVAAIRQTMESFFAQTWAEKEYIVIEGVVLMVLSMSLRNTPTVWPIGALNLTRDCITR